MLFIAVLAAVSVQAQEQSQEQERNGFQTISL